MATKTLRLSDAHARGQVAMRFGDRTYTRTAQEAGDLDDETRNAIRNGFLILDGVSDLERWQIMGGEQSGLPRPPDGGGAQGPQEVVLRQAPVGDLGPGVVGVSAPQARSGNRGQDEYPVGASARAAVGAGVSGPTVDAMGRPTAAAAGLVDGVVQSPGAVRVDPAEAQRAAAGATGGRPAQSTRVDQPAGQPQATRSERTDRTER